MPQWKCWVIFVGFSQLNSANCISSFSGDASFLGKLIEDMNMGMDECKH